MADAPDLEMVEAFIADYNATPLEIEGSVGSGGTRQERQLAFAVLSAIARGGKAPSDFKSPTAKAEAEEVTYTAQTYGELAETTPAEGEADANVTPASEAAAKGSKGKS